MGQGDFREGASYEPLAIFPHRFAFWLAVKEAGMAQGVDVPLLTLNITGALPQPFLEALRTEALNAVITWTTNHGRRPTSADFSGSELPFQYARLVGAGHYRADGSYGSHRLFDSRDDYLRALEAHSLAQTPDEPSCAPSVSGS